MVIGSHWTFIVLGWGKGGRSLLGQGALDTFGQRL